MNFVVNLIITAAVALLLANFLPGVEFTGGFTAALVFSLVLAVLNATLKPILKILGLPLTILTLGLFSLVINAIVISAADYLIGGMEIHGFFNTIVFSIALSLVTSLVSAIFTKE